MDEDCTQKVVEDRIEVSSSDENKLKLLIDQGYVGVRFIKKGTGEILKENKIVFEKFRL